LPYDEVRLRRGAGINAFAAIAFLRGNPAITLIRTVYFKSAWHSDFSAADARARAELLHELTHILQYRRLGGLRFALRYTRELAAHGFRPGRLYAYRASGKTFPTATLEGQAEMVGNYAEAMLRGDDLAMAEIAPWLEGSGLFEF
jgi:hypothetical protein